MADIVYPGQTPGGTIGQGFLPANYDLVLYRGDYFPMSVTLKNASNVVMNLTGYTGKASIRMLYEDPVAYNFTVTIPAPTTGVVELVLPSVVSATIAPGSYVWDFQLTEPNGTNTRTYIAGDVQVYDEVTR